MVEGHMGAARAEPAAAGGEAEDFVHHMSMLELLEEVVRLPMQPTLLDVPADVLARAMEQWRQCLVSLRAVYGDRASSSVQRRQASLWAYALPGLLLRRPPRAEGDADQGAVPLKTVLRRRLKLAEVPEERY